MQHSQQNDSLKKCWSVIEEVISLVRIMLCYEYTFAIVDNELKHRTSNNYCEGKATRRKRVFKLALANASRYILLRSKVLSVVEEVISLIRIMLCYEMRTN